MLRHYIGGHFDEGAPERVISLIDPSTGEQAGSAAVGRMRAVDAAVLSAAEAADKWAGSAVRQRARLLLRLADLLEARSEELASLECAATGKPRHFWVDAELAHTVDVLRFTAGAARSLPGVAAGEYLPGMTSWMRQAPVGVVVAIVPWNFPLMMAVWKVAPILAAGNACVLKPAPSTPATALKLAALAVEAGFPPGALNVVCGDADTGRLLMKHPQPAMVAFTGSVAAGREVAATAGGSLKRTHLELGGKAPVVVLGDLADAPDLDERLMRICGAAMFNAGQSCTAATRVIADRAVYERVVSGLGQHASKITVGNNGDYGALISAEQLNRVSGLVDRRGAHTRLVTGGHRIGSVGFFYAPTVIADVHADDELAREEVFGPVMTVECARDEQDAVKLANDTDYGLAASVWTRDHAAAMRVSTRLAAGDVWINTHGMQAVEMPHGGSKQSGWGSDLSMMSILDYTRRVHVGSQWN